MFVGMSADFRASREAQTDGLRGIWKFEFQRVRGENELQNKRISTFK